MTLQSDSFLAGALKAAHETRVLEIGQGILERTPTVFRAEFGDRPAVIIADRNTFSVAGKQVQLAFGGTAREPFIFEDPSLYAEDRFVAELEVALREHDAIPVAVGSGTINDLAKLASHRTGRRYISVPTAASMDGYTAFGASITSKGLKQTFSCPAPVAVLADLDVICEAPNNMNAWGYADLAAKVTAGADWIVADTLGAEKIDLGAWTIVQSSLREMISDADGVPARNPLAIQKLAEGLMLCGFAMQSASSSRPASGAEHQFSHVWDMQHHTHNGAAPSHGFKVGIGTVAVTALYEQLFRLPLEKLDVDRCCRNWPGSDDWDRLIVGLHGEGDLANGALREIRAKSVTESQLRAQLEILRDCWPELKERLQAQLIPLAKLQEQLRAAGAPTEPEEIGISRTRLRDTFLQAFSIRRRFTVLDLAVRVGALETCLERIFGPEGLWPISGQAETTTPQTQKAASIF